MAKGPHVSVSAEKVFEVFGMPITNSITLGVVVLAFTAFIGNYYYTQLHSKKKSDLFYILHGMFMIVFNLVKSTFDKKVYIFFPLLGSFFFFILFNNWFGLLPGVGSFLVDTKDYPDIPFFRAATADINTTLMLGILAVVIIQFNGIKALGMSEHLHKYINFSSPIDFFVGILEIISEFSRIISFAFRLFGNIFAGEVLLVILAFLIPYFVSFPFLILEIFVGLIQALVFTMLTAVLINVATLKHH